MSYLQMNLCKNGGLDWEPDEEHRIYKNSVYKNVNCVIHHISLLDIQKIRHNSIFFSQASVNELVIFYILTSFSFLYILTSVYSVCILLFISWLIISCKFIKI